MMSRPNLKISPRALVCQDNELRGEIYVGAGTVLHPQCKVWATGGAIIFGSGNIVEENAVIINRGPEALIIGDNNVFEVGSAHVKVGTWLGDECVIGTVCSTNENEILPDRTVIYGSKNDRRIFSGNRTNQLSVHQRHLDYLMQILPKFNHARSST
ncbi:hypothetical protein BGZ74_001457 [Mortierella antarctica]|nr:hypothetical protein BGZ74_001457 [Mortierella antarctica]